MGSLTMIVEAIKIYNCLFYVGNEYIFIGVLSRELGYKLTGFDEGRKV